LNSIGLYFHTLRHLRPIQVIGRVRHKLLRPRADTRAPPARRMLAAPFAEPAAPESSMSAADEFEFLGLRQRCATPADWNSPRHAALWTYNLHYFDDLNARDAASRQAWHRALLGRWIAENPPGHGAGWDPYPLSRRIVNWVKWILADNAPGDTVHASLAVQARWLTQRLEYHLLGNHLFANAKALVFAGLYFDGAEAARWLETGLNIVNEQLAEQVLPDGGHFERSTMYHAAALEDLLDLVNVLQAAGRPVERGWLDVAARMQRWLDVMRHPDGGIAFFNDAALGIAPDAEALCAYAARLGHAPRRTPFQPLELLRASGYARLAQDRWCVLADFAPVGPDYLPGHAHADTLSFEASVGTRRVFVNGGTSEYGQSAERSRQRGTPAHNTVVVDGADSSEMWAGFRVARRARASLLAAGNGPIPTLAAEHDGYRRLAGRNVHRRHWTLRDGGLHIEDEVSGRFARAEAFFHLHPGITVTRQEAGRVHFDIGGQAASLEFKGAAVVELRPSTWHPRFGMSVPAAMVVARFAGPRLQTSITLG
jgi:uncharacterized heparinase superfamily protein